MAPGEQLPTLPIIFTQGHDWWLMLAYMQADDQVIILGNEPLGSSQSVLGIYSILAAVQRLARGIRQDFNIWFDRAILKRNV